MGVVEREAVENTAWEDTCSCGRKPSLPVPIEGRTVAGREFIDCCEG